MGNSVWPVPFNTRRWGSLIVHGCLTACTTTTHIYLASSALLPTLCPLEINRSPSRYKASHIPYYVTRQLYSVCKCWYGNITHYYISHETRSFPNLSETSCKRGPGDESGIVRPIWDTRAHKILSELRVAIQVDFQWSTVSGLYLWGFTLPTESHALVFHEGHSTAAVHV